MAKDCSQRGVIGGDEVAAIMEISVMPMGKDEASLGDVVVEVLKVAEREGLNYEVNPMGTTLEGDVDMLLRVAREMHEVCFSMGYPRAQTVIHIDERRDKELTMKYKVESVKAKLAERALHIREN